MVLCIGMMSQVLALVPESQSTTAKKNFQILVTSPPTQNHKRKRMINIQEQQAGKQSKFISEDRRGTTGVRQSAPQNSFMSFQAVL